MSLSEAQTFGFSDSVSELYEKARKELEDGGLDVDAILSDLRRVHEDAAMANAVQEQKKREAKAATEAFVPKKRALYHAASSALDMAIGAVGKETTAAANFRKLRSDIDREARAEEPMETPGGQPPGSPA